jgi:hypothetical protein
VPYRSTFALGALLALALALAAAPAAQSEIPAGAPTVAGPTADGISVVVFLRGQRLCVALRTPEQATNDGVPNFIGEDEPQCDAVPVLAPFDSASAMGRSISGTSHYTEAGIVGSDVAAVEWRKHGKIVAHAATAPSPLPGAAADVRFYLIERELKVQPDETAYLDAAGAVRRAYDEGDPFTDPTSWNTAAPTHRRVIQHGGHGTGRWKLTTAMRRSIASTPLQPERKVDQPCVSFEGYRGSGSSTCDSPDQATRPLLQVMGAACAPVGRYVAVLARPYVRRVFVVLGDGTRRTIPLTAVPGAQAGTRAGVVTLGTGVAVRRLVGLGGGDRRLTDADYGLPPVPGGKCQEIEGGVSIIRYSNALPRTSLGRGAHTPVVQDEGPLVCLAIDRAPRHPGECDVAPIDVTQTYLDAEPTADGRYVAGLVPPEVTSARLELDDGTARDVTATAIPAYTGQYAQVLKLVAADVPGPHRVVGFDLLDARGRTLQRGRGAPEAPAVEHQTTLLRTPGLPALRAGDVPRSVLDYGPITCLGFGPLSIGSLDGCLFAYPRAFTVQALCAPRRIVVTGLLAHRADRVAIRLAGGHEIAARTAALPATIRRGGGAALVVLGPHDAPRRLILRGRASGSAPLVLPTAAEQCGYADSASLDRRFN